MGHVAIRNVGKVPAQNVWLDVRMSVIDLLDYRRDPSISLFAVPEDPKKKDREFKIDRAIQPGTEMRQGCDENDCVPVLDLLAMEQAHVYVWGVVYYDDGVDRRFTEFRHRYPVAGANWRDDWGLPANRTREIISIDKARFEPDGNNAN